MKKSWNTFFLIFLSVIYSKFQIDLHKCSFVLTSCIRLCACCHGNRVQTVVFLAAVCVGSVYICMYVSRCMCTIHTGLHGQLHVNEAGAGVVWEVGRSLIWMKWRMRCQDQDYIILASEMTFSQPKIMFYHWKMRNVSDFRRDTGEKDFFCDNNFKLPF